MSIQEPEQTPLEPHVLMPKGGVAARCQRRKRDGSQCAKPARTGFRVCPTHGAGYPSREAAGTRKRPGRPVEHGIYSVQPTRSFAETQAEVAQLEDALTSSDRDLIALKSVLALRMAELEAHGDAVQEMEATLEDLTAEAVRMDPDSITPETAVNFARRFAALRQPVAKLNKLASEVVDTATKSIQAGKTRAETKAKLSELEGTEAFLKLLAVIMKIVRDLSPDQNSWETYQLALQREVLGPNRLEAPPLDLEPDEP